MIVSRLAAGAGDYLDEAGRDGPAGAVIEADGCGASGTASSRAGAI